MKKSIRKFSLPRPAKVSEEMKAWSAALAVEMASWPQVRSRVFFGYTAFYRRDAIFALLPRTRALDPLTSIAFKLESASPRIRARAKQDPRVGFTEMRKARWFTFELSSNADLATPWVGCNKRMMLRVRSIPPPCDLPHIALSSLLERTFEHHGVLFPDYVRGFRPTPRCQRDLHFGNPL